MSERRDGFIPTIEGRRSSARHPIPAEQRASEVARIRGELSRHRILTTQKLSNASRRVVAELLDFATRAAAERDEARAALAAVTALVRNTDGDWLSPESFDGLAGEVQAVVAPRPGAADKENDR